MPPVSRIELGKELLLTLREINHQIEEVAKAARVLGTSPYAMRDERGNFVLSPLIVAKAQLVHGLALLNQKGN